MNRWFSFLLFAVCCASRATASSSAGSVAFDIPLASSNDAALLVQGDFTTFPRPPPVFTWQTDAPAACRMVPDEATGTSCLALISPSSSSVSTLRIFSPMTAPKSGRAIVAVEARGTGRFRIQLNEYAKKQSLGGAQSAALPLTRVWRWYFYEYARADDCR